MFEILPPFLGYFAADSSGLFFFFFKLQNGIVEYGFANSNKIIYFVAQKFIVYSIKQKYKHPSLIKEKNDILKNVNYMPQHRLTACQDQKVKGNLIYF